MESLEILVLPLGQTSHQEHCRLYLRLRLTGNELIKGLPEEDTSTGGNVVRQGLQKVLRRNAFRNCFQFGAPFRGLLLKLVRERKAAVRRPAIGHIIRIYVQKSVWEMVQQADTAPTYKAGGFPGSARRSRPKAPKTRRQTPWRYRRRKRQAAS